MPHDFPPVPATLLEALSRAACHFPHRGIGLIDRRGRRGERCTYGELLGRTRKAARRFRRLGLGPGERVLVCLHTSWEWLDAWFGALCAGGWPVAISPPGALGSPAAHVRRVDAVCQQIGARFVVCSPSFQAEAERLGLPHTLQAAVTSDSLAQAEPVPSWQDVDVDPASTAFLQLTSGSTGRPRAVEISHRAAIHNPVASSEAIGRPHGEPTHTWASSMVSWLPLHHDMGLVGGVLFSMLNGLDLWLLSPRIFLARPALWLHTLATTGISLSPAPNFAYQLCVERLDPAKLDGFDLSGWRAAMTGAEMIRPDTVRAFCDAFSPYGFRPAALRACYGLAETTLAVTFDGKGEGLRTLAAPADGAEQGGGEVACVGQPVRDTEIRIASPGGATLPEARIGEVQIRGPGVFSRYFDDPKATEEAFQGGWFRSGDLGFVSQGELYLTGRNKEILIIRGQNLMPHDVEWVAESLTGSGGAARCGAFSVAAAAEGEQAVLVMEVVESDPDRLGSLSGEIRRRVGRELGLPLAEVVFVRRGQIPKTTSGKVQRHELRELYMEGRLERLGESG